ncbi:MAG TPA: nucleotidyl transferase AbiEii/AbiGii toxin family protein [Steroidobacteraceae bacterium]|nr:nucleotidyl transferase AbiEii/AbiGii toxin family protein [Steroidobacteraceae bacterium]
MNQQYVDTVRLLLTIAPAVFRSPRFALKGGTALNLFVHDMPRLSVDIDVTFTDHILNREDALRAIAEDLKAAKSAISALGFRAHLPTSKGGENVKLLVEGTGQQIKVEVNFVLRGTVLPITHRPLAPRAQELFTTDVILPVLDFAELYGGKLVAAMDRQHPRDIFDVLQMQERFGWQSSFVDCFVAYLAGHNRPVHEVLFPNRLPLEPAFSSEFTGLTTDEVALETLEQTQSRLIDELPHALTSRHREFLLSLVSAEPAWDLMPFANLQHLPAPQWKLINLRKLKMRNPARFSAQRDELVSRFANLPQPVGPVAS